MMRFLNRSHLSIVLITLVSGVALFTFFTREQEPARVFSATLNRDCAPWDGAAFTVAIQHDSGSVIYITIWRAPEFKRPTTFPMPDDVEAEQDGHAYLLQEPGPYTPLHGKVSFQRVEAGAPLEGSFSLKSAGGEWFEGRFFAEWGDQIALCG